MPPPARREFSGNAVPTTITSTIAAGDLTINIAASTGWPAGATGPFIVTIDQGLATEEKIEVASRTGLVLTVTPTGRGHDNTAAVGHGSGSKIEHTMSARDLAEANAHAADVTRDDHSQYLNAARHAATVHDIDASEIQDGSVLAAKLEAAQRHLAGDFKFSILTADHAGWLLCDGRTVTIASQPALWAAMGSAHIFGTDPGSASFRIPDLRKKYLMGKAAAGVGSTLGGSFGTADAVVPTHAHTMKNHTHSGSTGNDSVNHTHTMKNHVHWVNGVGDHQHIVNSGGHEVAFLYPGANGKLVTTGNAEGITFSDINPAGGHDHGNTGGPNDNTTDGVNTWHQHAFTTGAPNDNTSDAAGVSGVDANLPPSIAVNGFIHV